MEISITALSDWGFQQFPGVFIDEPNRHDWVRRGGLGIKEGSVVRAADTLYMGFGFEGIAGSKTRNDVMGGAIDYLRR